MPIKGIDYRTSGASALTGVNANAIQSDGYQFVGEYLGNHLNSGYLTQSDTQQLGLPIVSLYERYPDHIGYFTVAQADADAGAASTASAITAAENIAHQQLGTCIYFCIDPAYEAGVYSGTGALSANYISAIKTYFQRISDDIAAQGNPYTIGVYGPGDALNTVMSLNLPNVKYYWVDNHWGGTTFNGTANIQRNSNQVPATPTSIGVNVDTDTANTTDYGQWVPQTQLAQNILSVAESKLQTAWGDENCTGFVFSVAAWAGVPFFYQPGMTDGYGLDYLKEVGAYGAGHMPGLLNDKNSNNDNNGFVVPVYGVGGVFDASKLSQVLARPDGYDSNWTLVNGGAPSSYFTVIDNSNPANMPQPGDLFRGVAENGSTGRLILHSGIVESYDPTTQTLVLVSNWEGSYISRDAFSLISSPLPANTPGRYILSGKSTFYRLKNTGPTQVAGTVTAAPGSGAFKAGSTISLSLATSSPTLVSGGTPVLNLSNGKSAAYVSGSGTSTLVFSYLVGAADDITSLGVVGLNPRGANLTDSSGNAVTLPSISTTFSGLRIDTIAPTVSSPSLTVNSTALATPIGIGTPTDAGGSALTVTVTSLPGDGTVYQSNGTTAVSQGQSLTVAQLTSLTFRPNGTTSSQTSNFTYSVADAAGNISAGTAKLNVNASDTISGTLVGTNLVPSGTTKTISSAVSLSYQNLGTIVHAVLENAGTLIILPGGSIASDGSAGDVVVNDLGGNFYINAPTLFDEMIPFTNNGTLTVAPGDGGTAKISSYQGYTGVAFTNGASGTVHVSSGTLNIDRGGTSNASAFSVDNGASFLVTGAPTSPSFTFSGGTYSVNGTTQVGDANHWGSLTFAGGTTVDASNKWAIYGPTDFSAATINGTFDHFQINPVGGTGNGNAMFGSQNVTLSGALFYNGFTFTTTGAVNLIGTTTMADTHNDGGNFSSNFNAGVLNNYGTWILDHEQVGSIGTLNNYGTISATQGGVAGTTINNLSGATLSISGGGTTVSAINNSGALNLDGTSSPVALFGLLTNNGTVIEKGTVYFQGGFVNSGTIIGSSTVPGNVAAITIGARETSASGALQGSFSGSSSVTNNGTVDAAVGLAVDPINTDNITVTNSSVIQGRSGTAIQLGQGNDRLVLDTTSAILGIVDGGTGSNTIELTAGAGSGALVGLGTDYLHFGQLIVDAGAIWQISGTAASQPNVVNDGIIGVAVNALSLGAVTSDVGQSGTFSISDGGMLELQGAVGSSQTLMFSGRGTVKIDHPGQFAGVISDLGYGDSIDLVGITATSATTSNGTVTVTNNGTTVATLSISGGYPVNTTLVAAPDGNGGTNLVILPQHANADFNGDGNGDVLWQNMSGQAGIWLLSGTDILTQVNTGSNPGPNWHVRGSGDFNGDHESDILWQNDSGQAGIWLMNGTTPQSQVNVGSNPGPSWKVIGTGDFDNNGKADILWQNLNTGQAGIWLMNGTSVISTPTIGTSPGADWRIVGSGDFDGNGKSDILWQNTNGQAGIWFMNGANIVSQLTTGSNPGASWHVICAADFNGDGKSDILWQNDSGQIGIWLMSGNAVITAPTVGDNPGSNWKVTGAADVNGDGKADILLQNSSGQASVWLMDGTTVLSQLTIGNNPGSDWHIANDAGGLASNPVSLPGDFNGDGSPDLLWQNDSGQMGIWLLNGTAVLTAPLVGTNPGASWHVIGSGDFNGDGKADVLWQSDSGQAGIWLMNGTTALATPTVGPNPGASWKVIASGDFDGNGKSDILWQSTSGQAGIWLMDGTTVLSQAQVGSNPGPAWHVIGAGDFNGDGKADILWQNDNGQVGIWLMNGTTVLSAPIVGPNPGASWHAIAAADFDGDGKADILWQNADGQAGIWLMNGTTVLSQLQTGNNPGSAWKVKGAEDVNGDGKADILWQNTNGQAAVWLMSGNTVLNQPLLGNNPGTAWHMITNPGA